MLVLTTYIFVHLSERIVINTKIDDRFEFQSSPIWVCLGWLTGIISISQLAMHHGYVSWGELGVAGIVYVIIWVYSFVLEQTTD